MMENVGVALLLLVILGGAGFYVYKAKKQGSVCIGCPHAKTCGKKTCCGGGEENADI